MLVPKTGWVGPGVVRASKHSNPRPLRLKWSIAPIMVPVTRRVSGNLVSANIKMFADQAPLQLFDGAARVVILSLDREIAFRIKPHGPVVQIRRAHAQEPVVNQHQL